jgi:arabinofuranan 3-O-arabinosyltransferase
VGLASLFVALSLYATLNSQPGRYVPDARLEHVVAPEQYLAREAYLWDDSRSLGNPISPFYFSPATAALQAAAAGLGAQAWLIERLTHALYLSIAALGVILLLREFRPRIGLEHGVAAFVYAFSPFTSQFLLPSGIFLYYALAPWFAWIALRGLREEDTWRWAAAFALAVAAGGAVNVAALGFALIPAALTALYFSVRERGGLEHLWRWIWRAGLLSLLTCSASIVVLSLSGPETSANLRTTESAEAVGRTSSWFESWRGLGFWLTYSFESPSGLLRPEATSYFTAPAAIVASFLAPLGALVALALGRWRPRILFGAMVLVSLVLMVGIHDGSSPFGQLLSFSFDHSEIVQGLRTTYKAGAGLMLGTAVLLGVGVASAVAAATRGPVSERQPRRAETRVRTYALGVVLPLVVTLGVVVASYPFWTERLYSKDGFRSIPRYWDQTFEYLGSQARPGRVLVFPGVSEERHRWGDVHDSLFDALSPLTPVMNRVLPQGTAESADLVAAIDEYVRSPGYVTGTLGPILSRLGVQWVLLQNDLDWQRTGISRPATYNSLRFDPGLRLVARFGRLGENTFSQDDLAAGLIGERALPPVELYKVVGAHSPGPRLAAGPPLLVEGGGDSWPALAAAGLLEGPPVAYTGAMQDDFLRETLTSGARLVVTDGNRRRAMLAGTAHPTLSPTLAVGEPSDRQPADLFGGTATQSVATFADARWITASRYGFPLDPYDAAVRPARAFDGVERTAWTVRGPLDPDGESLTVKLREPQTVTAVSVLAHADGPWRVRAVDAVLRRQDGGETVKRLRFSGARYERARARVEASGVAEIELRIADVDGPGPVGIAGVGIAEAGIDTPSGPLDLREFVRTPDDLATGAATDERLARELASSPPRYELRRVPGVGKEDEETELRREITAFGDHRYKLNLTARVNARTPDRSIDAILGAPVGAVGTSRFVGDLNGFGGLAVDDDLSTGWQPEPLAGQRLDVHFPTAEVSNVEVLVVSGPNDGVARSRVTGVDVAVGDLANESVRFNLSRKPRCESQPPAGGCLETSVVQVPPTVTDHLSVALTGIEPLRGRFGTLPPEVVEVRINGQVWSEIADPQARRSCAPLFAVDGRQVELRLPRDSRRVLAGEDLKLGGCTPVQLGPGRHRLETLPGLSSASLGASLVPSGERPGVYRPPTGKVELLDHSPTQLDLWVTAPKGALLIGGMPWHHGWVADGGELGRSPVPLDTFSAWTVEASTDGHVTLRFTPQTTYELAIALSIATAAWCVWRVTRRRRREVR